MPFRLHTDTVASDARFVMHDRNALFDNAIEQGGFADVGSADDGDKSCHVASLREITTARKPKAPVPVPSGMLWQGF